MAASIQVNTHRLNYKETNERKKAISHRLFWTIVWNNNDKIVDHRRTGEKSEIAVETMKSFSEQWPQCDKNISAFLLKARVHILFSLSIRFSAINTKWKVSSKE